MFKADTKIISIDVSSVCYADCIYCLHQRQKMITPQNIKLETARKILDIINHDSFSTIVTPLTGEAFCNPILCDILEEIAIRFQRGIVATKLIVPVYMRRLARLLQRFQHHGSTLEIAITLDSVRQSTLEKISPGIHLPTVLGNIQRLCELRSRFASLEITMQTVVTKYNETELEELRVWANAKNISWVAKQLQYYMASLASRENIDLIKSAYPTMKEYQVRFRWEGEKIISKIGHCPSLNPAIALNGDLLICCMDMLVKHPVGNILEVGSIRGLLNSEKFKYLSSEADARRLSICQDCN